MKTRALLLALPILALASCRDNRASIQVQAVCAPTKDCTFQSTCDAQFIGFTTIDATGPGDLWLFLQVENQLPDNTDRSAGRVNTNDAHLDEAVVEYEGIALPRDVYELPNFRVPAQGTAVVSVEAIRPVGTNRATLAAFAPTSATRDMVANVRLRGYLDDGSRFETGEFGMGIRVCSGCTGSCAVGQLACPSPPVNGAATFPGMEPFACGTVQ